MPVNSNGEVQSGVTRQTRVRAAGQRAAMSANGVATGTSAFPTSWPSTESRRPPGAPLPAAGSGLPDLASPHRAPSACGLIPQSPTHDAPGSSAISASPVRNAFGGQVIGSTARLRRPTSESASPVNSITYG